MILADRAYFCADASTRVFEDVLAGYMSLFFLNLLFSLVLKYHNLNFYGFLQFRFAGFFLEPSFSCNSSETDTNSYIDEKT